MTLLVLPILFAAAVGGASKKVNFYIGTYTSDNGSQGIYQATLDTGTGELSNAGLAANAVNPSYLALSPNGRTLCSVDESEHGDVTSYSVSDEGDLMFVSSQPLNGKYPCCLSVDPRGKHVLAACYDGGVVSCLPLKADSSLGPVSGEVDNSGSGPNHRRQGASHMHWIEAAPEGRFAYSCDLGSDKVQCYRVEESGKLIDSHNGAKAPDGTGPRHGAFGRKGKFLYVANEMGSSVDAFLVEDKSGALTRIQTVSTLKLGVTGNGNTAAEIACHPSGQWLYVSNRGDDSIAVFRIAKDGLLTLIQVKALGLETPRSFAIDPGGRWIVAAGQESNDLESLRIEKDGMLGDPGQKISVHSPTCVVFARR